MLVDWKIPPRCDSGHLFARQSAGADLGAEQPGQFNPPDGSGGLYNNKKNPRHPLKNADNAVGQWNRFRIVMAGEKVHVFLNGQTVVNDTTLENYWQPDKTDLFDRPDRAAKSRRPALVQEYLYPGDSEQVSEVSASRIRLSSMNHPQSRRTFIQQPRWARQVFSWPFRLRGARKISANEKLNIGMIGVAHQAHYDMTNVASENIVALCDVDDSFLAGAAKKYPGPKTYEDFRRLLDQKDIDAVVIATPDHTHAVATVAALKSGVTSIARNR